MSRLSRAEQEQIELLLSRILADYPVLDPDAVRHVKADFCQALDHWSESASVQGATCAAAYTPWGGRDTGHALCGSTVGPVTLESGKVSCADCIDRLTYGWDEG